MGCLVVRELPLVVFKDEEVARNDAGHVEALGAQHHSAVAVDDDALVANGHHWRFGNHHHVKPRGHHALAALDALAVGMADRDAMLVGPDAVHAGIITGAKRGVELLVRFENIVFGLQSLHLPCCSLNAVTNNYLRYKIIDSWVCQPQWKCARTCGNRLGKSFVDKPRANRKFWRKFWNDQRLIDRQAK